MPPTAHISALLLLSLLWACQALAAPAPAPQDIPFSLADSLPDVTYTTTASSVTYNPTSVLQAALPQITSVLTDDGNTTVIAKRNACQAQPTGAGPVPPLDNPSAFLNYTAFATAASNAAVPTGYTQAFSNLQASSNAYGYLGFATLTSYDSNACAAKCNKINGCIAFNLFFERDPTVEPGTGCANPASTTTIKCVFWGGPVSADNALNNGQWRANFQVVIAGSNGYVNNSITTPSGYTSATDLGKAAIAAPLDQYGFDSHIGSAIFTSGPFDASLCAKACSEKSAFNLANPPTDSSPVQTCQFFNTYILYINTTQHLQGQVCQMYSESWSAEYATNVGQTKGYDHWLIEYSYSYSNVSNPGVAAALPAVYQASRDILSASLQPFCSELLGFATPVTTVTSTSTTHLLSLTTTTSISLVESTITSIVTTITNSPTTTIYSTVTTTLPAGQSPMKRSIALSTPDILTKYPVAVMSSACSLQATPVTTTSTSTVLTIVSVNTASTSTTATSTTSTVTVASTAGDTAPMCTHVDVVASTWVNAVSCGTYTGGEFAIQANGKYAAVIPNGDNSGMVFGAKLSDLSQAQLFTLDENCILTIVNDPAVIYDGPGPVPGYNPNAVRGPAIITAPPADSDTSGDYTYDPVTGQELYKGFTDIGGELVYPMEFIALQAYGMSPATCVMDSLNGMNCNFGSPTYNIWTELFWAAMDEATAQQENLPELDVTAVFPNPCGFSGQFAIQANYNQQYLTTDVNGPVGSNIDPVGFLAGDAVPDADIFYLDENCYLTKNTTGPYQGWQAYQSSQMEDAEVYFYNPQTVKNAGLAAYTQNVVCTIQTNSNYALSCSAGRRAAGWSFEQGDSWFVSEADYAPDGQSAILLNAVPLGYC